MYLDVMAYMRVIQGDLISVTSVQCWSFEDNWMYFFFKSDIEKYLLTFNTFTEFQINRQKLVIILKNKTKAEVIKKCQ